jgi:hypothetical protein
MAPVRLDPDHRSLITSIKNRPKKSPPISVGARVVWSGAVGLYGRPRGGCVNHLVYEIGNSYNILALVILSASEGSRSATRETSLQLKLPRTTILN